jgi:hypothetical protein
MHRPLLAGSAGASCNYQRCAIEQVALEYVEALAADADDSAIQKAPLLTGRTATGYGDDSGAFVRGAALDVKTAAADSGNLAVDEVPLLVGSTVTLKDPHLCAIGHIPMLRQHHAFVAIPGNEHVARRAPDQGHNGDSHQKQIFHQLLLSLSGVHVNNFLSAFEKLIQFSRDLKLVR